MVDGRVEVLLAEDNEADVALTRRALRDGTIQSTLHVVGDGEAALRFVRREGEHRDAPRPDLVLLDINMPRMGGLEVLAAIKEDPELRTIPVCVLSSSDNDRDVQRAYAAHANAFITKPIEFERFAQAVRAIEGFWFGVVRLPGR
jgi:CheY-like chemotaxis protein